jgi:ABC-type multidrug transport system fused ATPase/permease subunit
VHLRGSDLDGTILGPGALTFDDPSGRIRIDPDGRGAVARADVAAVIAVVLQDPGTIGRTIRFGNGDQESALPIAEALAR